MQCHLSIRKCVSVAATSQIQWHRQWLSITWAKAKCFSVVPDFSIEVFRSFSTSCHFTQLLTQVAYGAVSFMLLFACCVKQVKGLIGLHVTWRLLVQSPRLVWMWLINAHTAVSILHWKMPLSSCSLVSNVRQLLLLLFWVALRCECSWINYK